jgi:hypothetical protein
MGIALEPKGSIAIDCRTGSAPSVRAIRCSTRAQDIHDLRVNAGVGVKA